MERRACKKDRGGRRAGGRARGGGMGGGGAPRVEGKKEARESAVGALV